MEKLLLMVMSEAIYLRQNSDLLGQVWWYGWRMNKLLLPLLVFACAGFSQVPKDKEAEFDAWRLARVLKGASIRSVRGQVSDLYGNLDKDLKTAIETKLKLGMKRNKLTDEFIAAAPSWESEIVIWVGAINSAQTGRVLAYTWRVNIGREVSTSVVPADGLKPQILPTAYYNVVGGTCGNVVDLKDAIDAALDTIFLAYLELPKVAARVDPKNLDFRILLPPPKKPKK